MQRLEPTPASLVDLTAKQRQRDWGLRQREDKRQRGGVRKALHDLFGTRLDHDEDLVAALVERGIKPNRIAAYHCAGSIARAVAKSLVIEALTGNVEAVRLIFAQTERPLPQEIEHSFKSSSIDEAAFSAMTREERLATINAGLLSAVSTSEAEPVEIERIATQEAETPVEAMPDMPQDAKAPQIDANAVLRKSGDNAGQDAGQASPGPSAMPAHAILPAPDHASAHAHADNRALPRAISRVVRPPVREAAEVDALSYSLEHADLADADAGLRSAPQIAAHFGQAEEDAPESDHHMASTASDPAPSEQPDLPTRPTDHDNAIDNPLQAAIHRARSRMAKRGDGR